MIEQNILNICHLINRAFARVKKPLSLSETQVLELAIAFTFLRRIDCLIWEYGDESYYFYEENKDKLSDKQLDEKLKEISGDQPFYNYSSYYFEGIINSGYSIEVTINSYLQGFSSNITDILDGLNFRQNVAILQRRSVYLVDLFNFFYDLDLSKSSLHNKQFIELIAELISDSSRNVGLFPTPVGLSKLICECLFCDEACKGLIYGNDYGTTIYDPVCGTGSLLAYAGEKAKVIYDYEEELILRGQEISQLSSAVANALVLLTGGQYSYVEGVNTLTKEKTNDVEYKFIVGNLPLGLSWAPFKERIQKESLIENGRYSRGLPSTNDSQFLFIQDIVSKMDCLGGRAAFISSSYVLQGGSIKSGEARIRMWLIESGFVETIIALPTGILQYTNTPVYLWILSSCDSNINGDNEFCKRMEGKVRLIDATQLVSSNNHFSVDDKFIDNVLKEYKSLENTSATKIINKDELGFYEVGLLENGRKKETVSISLDTDIKEFVEKERKPYAKGEITIDYASVEKGYSVDFSKFFKSEELPVASIGDESNRMLSVLTEINVLKKDIEAVVRHSTDSPVSDVWKELPLHAAIEIIQANTRPQVIDMRGLPIISVSYLRGEKDDEELYAVTNNTKRISSTDVIYVKTGANAGEVFRGVDGILSPTLAAIRCSNDFLITPQYLYYLLKGYEKTLRAMTSGASIKTLSTKSILDFKCLIPTVEEQTKIVAFLDDIVDKIDNIIKNIGSSNNIFSEYRQTLIENAVRGKLNL